MMVVKDYKTNKAQVLSIYKDFVHFCNQAGVQIETNATNQAEKIENEEFNIMVLGEAKSGKSTFINAYLGTEVLPMAVEQCTSAIIRIHYGSDFKLIYKNASGISYTIYGEKKIKDFLNNSAAVNDKYKQIPVATINTNLLINWEGKKIPQGVIDGFIEKIAEDNYFKLEKEEYRNLIIEYIRENQNKWGDIVTEIDISYPLPEAMKGITIIDSPGVGAGGDLGAVTERYIENANAIIFVKSLVGTTNASKSFMNFLRTNCSDRNKETLFLVCTNKALLSSKKFQQKRDSAKEMYKNDISGEKMIFVDSLAQLYLNKCRELGTSEEVQKLLDELEQEGDDFDAMTIAWNKSNNDFFTFEKKMAELSGFDYVYTALDTFARKASYIQLIDFLEYIKKEYIRMKASYDGDLKILESETQNADSIQNEINDLTKQIEELNNKMSEGVMDIWNKYTDPVSSEGIIKKKTQMLEKEYKDKFEEYRQLKEKEITEDTFYELKNLTSNMLDKTSSFKQSIAKQFIAECNEKLIECYELEEFISADAFIPNFTPLDFDEINANASEEAKEIYEKKTFGRVTQKIYQDRCKQVNIIINKIDENFNGRVSVLSIDINAFVNGCKDLYEGKLQKLCEERSARYSELVKIKADNDVRLKKIDEYKSFLQSLVEYLDTTSELMEELKNYVAR